VVLVDDEQLTRASLVRHISEGGLEVVGEAANTQDAINLVVDLRPDVVLMSLTVPGTPAVEAIEQLNLLAPASHVLVLTRTEQNQVVEAIVAGASGYILKTAPLDTIVSAIRATAAGESVISSKIAGKLLSRVRERASSSTTDHETASVIRSTLTARELEIFKKLSSGQSNHEIGRDLALSTNTVSNHIASILAKLQLDNRIQAAVSAVRSGLS
jgi:DNA-binding NarL/FixJ family response regulator